MRVCLPGSGRGSPAGYPLRLKSAKGRATRAAIQDTNPADGSGARRPVLREFLKSQRGCRCLRTMSGAVSAVTLPYKRDAAAWLDHFHQRLAIAHAVAAYGLDRARSAQFAGCLLRGVTDLFGAAGNAAGTQADTDFDGRFMTRPGAPRRRSQASVCRPYGRPPSGPAPGCSIPGRRLRRG